MTLPMSKYPPISEAQLKQIKEAWFEKALLREGLKTKVYKDTRGILTVGIGHRVLPEDGLQLGEQITNQEAFELFDHDSAWAIKAAIEQAVEIGCLTTDFIVALTSVNFQLGPKWKNQFFSTYPALVSGNYDAAIVNLLKSRWYKQTPVRVEDFIAAIKRIPKTGMSTEPKSSKSWLDKVILYIKQLLKGN